MEENRVNGKTYTRKVFNKRNPSDQGSFIAFPSDAKHYVNHPNVTADMLFLYALIIDYYNVEEGYAFPSLEELVVTYGKSDKTVSKHIEVLKEVGLIDYPEKGYYVPLKPLTSDEFYGAFPEAWTRYKTRRDRADKRKRDSVDRMQNWRENNGYSTK